MERCWWCHLALAMGLFASGAAAGDADWHPAGTRPLAADTTAPQALTNPIPCLPAVALGVPVAASTKPAVSLGRPVVLGAPRSLAPATTTIIDPQFRPVTYGLGRYDFDQASAPSLAPPFYGPVSPAMPPTDCMDCCPSCPDCCPPCQDCCPSSPDCCFPCPDCCPNCCPDCCTPLCCENQCGRNSSCCLYGGLDYLLWWVKSGPVPIPLVTGNNNPNTIAALTDPGTVVLFGAGANNSLNYGSTSGLRATVGAWLGSDQLFGVEGSGFLLDRQSVLFNAGSGGGTAPIVSIPFNATQPFFFNSAGETSLNAGGVPNAVAVSSSTRLWGAEANFLYNAVQNERYHLALLGGFRYLELDEALRFNDSFFDATTGGVLSVSDSFQTRNQFYGGQLGVKGGMTFGQLTVDAAAKCALGDSRGVLNINGSSITTNGAFGFPPVVGSGVFAEPSNIGRYQRDAFAVVPEVQFQVGYAVTERLRFFVGYDFLYISSVLRPGDQIDRSINPTQNTLFGGGVPTGPPAPLGATHVSDFWAQGVTFGLVLRY